MELKLALRKSNLDVGVVLAFLNAADDFQYETTFSNDNFHTFIHTHKNAPVCGFLSEATFVKMIF